MSEVLKETISQLFDDESYARDVVRREVPLLDADWGVKDEDALVHSLGVNLLSGLGRSLGQIGIGEYPVPRAERWQRKLVRVDSAWFDPSSRKVTLLSEFERFSRETAIEKLTNLYVAAHGCETVPDMLLLCLWSTDAVAVETPWLTRDAQFAVPGGPPVSKPVGTTAVIYHAIFGRRGEKLHFLRFRRIH